MTTTTDGSTHGVPAPKKKRRRWVKILLGVAAVVVLLVVLAPTLLSTGAGKNFILGKVNAQLAGRVEAEWISLGWFSGAKIGGLKVLDPEGGAVIEAPSVTTGLTVLGALGSSYDLGEVQADVGNVKIVTGADGSTNLARALAPRASAPAAAEKPSAAKEEPTAAGKPLIVRGNVTYSVAAISWQAPKAETLTLTNTAGHLNLDTAGKPLDFLLATQVAAGSRPPASVKLTAALNVFENGTVKKVAQITGTGHADIGTLDLAAMGPLLVKYGITVEKGTLGGNLTFDAPSAGTAKLAGQFVVDDPAVSGAALKGDRLALPRVTVPIDVTMAGGKITVAKAGVESELLTLGASGDVTMEAIGALLNPGAGATPADSHLVLTGTAKLAELARRAPHLVSLQKGTTVDSGTATLGGFISAKGGTTSAQLVATLPDVTGTRDGRKIALEPFRAQVDVGSVGTQLRPTARVLMPAGEGVAGGQTLKVSVAPKADDLSDILATASYDLTRLEAQLSQFIDLGDKKFGGAGDATAHVLMKSDAGGSTYAFDVTASPKNLVLVGFFKSDIREPELVAKMSGSATVSGAKLPAYRATIDDIDITGKTVSLRTGKRAAEFSYDSASGAMALRVPNYGLALDVAAWGPVIVDAAGLAEGTKLAGALRSGGAMVYENGVLQYGGETTIEGFQNVPPAGSAQAALPPTKVWVMAHVAVDTVKHAVSTLKECRVQEDEGNGKGQLLVVSAGGHFGWGGAAGKNADAEVASVDVSAGANYDLERLTKLLGGFLPEGAAGTGKRWLVFHLAGPVTGEAGLKKYRKLTLDPKSGTALAWETLSLPSYGISLGRADLGVGLAGGKLTLTRTAVPANEGKLTVAGVIDLNADDPAFVIEKGPEAFPLIDQVKLNKKLAAGPLAAFPLAWGVSPKDSSALNVSGVINVKLTEANLPLAFASLKKHGTIGGDLNLDQLTTDAPLFSMLSQIAGPLAKFADFGIRNANVDNVHFDMRDGRVRYQNFTLKISSVTFIFSGEVGLDFSDKDGTPLSMDVGIQLKQLPAPIVIHLEGTTAKLLPKLTSKSLEKTIENTAPQMIEGFLKKGLEKKK